MKRATWFLIPAMVAHSGCSNSADRERDISSDEIEFLAAARELPTSTWPQGRNTTDQCR
jgi:hypothetical protein